MTFSEDGSNIPDNADVIIVCAGNNPDAEYTKSNDNVKLEAASAGTDGSINNNGDVSRYQKLTSLMSKAQSKNKPIILMLFTDGPAVVTDAINNSKAVVCAWIGCPEGDAYANILYGDSHPTGKLNHSWPKTLEQIPINAGNMGDKVGSDPDKTPLFKLGDGLTY